ncbi:hypothetical protein EAG_01997 [Camponotus floridanus]|uniref:Uncharacterized protein n=1 Tax=Camponotus floridanus TaxID=104421 RepID=E2A2N9_CAMFO|nr:hypothetical protein EAG_01997 [Camponotus floridanus]
MTANIAAQVTMKTDYLNKILEIEIYDEKVIRNSLKTLAQKETPKVTEIKDKLRFLACHNDKFFDKFFLVHRFASNTNAITISSLILRFIFAFACIHRIGFGLFAEPSSKRSDNAILSYLMISFAGVEYNKTVLFFYKRANFLCSSWELKNVQCLQERPCLTTIGDPSVTLFVVCIANEPNDPTFYAYVTFLTRFVKVVVSPAIAGDTTPTDPRRFHYESGERNHATPVGAVAYYTCHCPGQPRALERLGQSLPTSVHHDIGLPYIHLRAAHPPTFSTLFTLTCAPSPAFGVSHNGLSSRNNVFSPSPRANSSLMICVATMADSRLIYREPLAERNEHHTTERNANITRSVSNPIATAYERCFPHFKSAKESNATHGGGELMLATGSSYWAGIARDTLCLANEAADVAADL